MVTLTLTDQEAIALRQMIDAAVRGQGLKAAEAGLYFDRKIAQAMEPIQQQQSNGGQPVQDAR